MNQKLLEDIEKRKDAKKMRPICYRIHTKEQKIIKLCGDEEYAVYDAAVQKICAGGVSLNSCRYQAISKCFEVKGWFLPSCAYEAVGVWTNKRYLGDARLHCLRTDVAEHYPVYGDARAGWGFKTDIELEPDETEAIIRCRKREKVIHEVREKIARS